MAVPFENRNFHKEMLKLAGQLQKEGKVPRLLLHSWNTLMCSKYKVSLKDQNIFVRYFAQPGIDNYLRITIGTDEQMDKLISALSEIVGQRRLYGSTI